MQRSPRNSRRDEEEDEEDEEDGETRPSRPSNVQNLFDPRIKKIWRFARRLGVTYEQFRITIRPFVRGLIDEINSGMVKRMDSLVRDEILDEWNKQISDGGVDFQFNLDGDEDEDETRRRDDLSYVLYGIIVSIIYDE